MTLSEAEQEALLEAARHDLWRRGELSWLLDDNQLQLYRAIYASPLNQFVIQAARKIGKSYLLAVFAFEIALRNPGGRVNYAAPSGKEAVEITHPIMTQLAALAPDDVRPIWVPSKQHWEFHNGAFIVVFGADDQASADRGRGPEAVANIVDEAAFTPVLSYLLDSVLAPQTLQTKGRTLIASTPPISPGHDFVDIAEAAASQGAYAHRDIYSHGRMTRHDIDAYLTQRAMSRGLTLEQFKRTSDFLREYMAITVLDSNLAVVPEFPAVQEQICIRQERPEVYDLYVSIDPGMADFTGVLFAYYDFKAAKLVITHELLLKQANTRTIADEVRKVLNTAYPGQKPYSAVVDDPHQRLVADLWNEHKLSFSPARKDDSEGAINLMRLEIGGQKVLIDPSCVHLIRQLGTAVRAKPGGDMARSKRDGHYDLVAALKYLIRSVDKFHNPYPVFIQPPDLNKAYRVVEQPATLSTALLGNSNIGRRLKRRQ